MHVDSCSGKFRNVVDILDHPSSTDSDAQNVSGHSHGSVVTLAWLENYKSSIASWMTISDFLGSLDRPPPLDSTRYSRHSTETIFLHEFRLTYLRHAIAPVTYNGSFASDLTDFVN